METALLKAWYIIRYVMLAVGTVYLGVTAVMFFMQSRFVFAPTRRIEETPESIGLSYEQVMFRADDGSPLAGWFVPVENERGTVLFCHGNAGNISHRLEIISILHKLGFSTFIFDYRGYGESGGRTSEKGTYRDAESAWRWLTVTMNIPSERIVIMGRSLGGPIAAWLAREHTPKALILESTFSSMPDMGAALYPWLPARFLSRFKYPTIEYVRDIRCPVLVVHSPVDDLVPFELGQRIFDAANEPKAFLEITGGHNRGFIDTGVRYVEGLDRFLTEHAAPRK